MKLIYSIAAFMFLGSLVSFAGELELSEHRVQWTGQMPAQTHYGTIDPAEITAEVSEDGVLTALTVVLDMATLTNEDLKKEKMRSKLEGHLKGKNFFFVDRYPKAQFTMTSFEDGILKGSLTIRSESYPQEMEAEWRKSEEGHWQLKTEFGFDRQKFKVNYQNGGFFGVAKNKLIDDEVEIGVNLKFLEK